MSNKKLFRKILNILTEDILPKPKLFQSPENVVKNYQKQFNNLSADQKTKVFLQGIKNIEDGKKTPQAAFAQSEIDKEPNRSLTLAQLQSDTFLNDEMKKAVEEYSKQKESKPSPAPTSSTTKKPETPTKQNPGTFIDPKTGEDKSYKYFVSGDKWFAKKISSGKNYNITNCVGFTCCL